MRHFLREGRGAMPQTALKENHWRTIPAKNEEGLF